MVIKNTNITGFWILLNRERITLGEAHPRAGEIRYAITLILLPK